MKWMPLGADPEEHNTLVDGIPAWMRSPMKEWFIARFTNPSTRALNVGLMRAFDMASKNPTPLASTLESHGPSPVFDFLEETETLKIVDFLIYVHSNNGTSASSDALEELEEMFTHSGSIWKVGTRLGVAGLERRVPEGVQIAADAVMALPITAGVLLSEAWHAAFGRSPDCEEAYEKAIKSVEEAGAEVLLPNNPKATLGTMAQTLEDQTAWRLDLGDDPKHTSRDVVAKMARALWSGQESRHGGNGYRKPTQAEAEAAVMLAVPLVQFFSSGAVAKR